MEHFDDFLAAARGQPEPQRLLLVFAHAECPYDATPAEREAFERGEGGALAPAVCVDKLPAEIASFAALLEESKGRDPRLADPVRGRDGRSRRLPAQFR
jgi:hypothetical protein